MVESRRHGDTHDGAARWPAVTATRVPVVRTHFVDRAGIDREPRVLLGVVVLHDLTGHGLRRMEIEEAAVRAEGTVDDARDEVRADDAEPDRERDHESGECPAEVVTVERVGEHLPQEVDHRGQHHEADRPPEGQARQAAAEHRQWSLSVSESGRVLDPNLPPLPAVAAPRHIDVLDLECDAVERAPRDADAGTVREEAVPDRHRRGRRVTEAVLVPEEALHPEPVRRRHLTGRRVPDRAQRTESGHQSEPDDAGDPEPVVARDPVVVWIRLEAREVEAERDEAERDRGEYAEDQRVVAVPPLAHEPAARRVGDHLRREVLAPARGVTRVELDGLEWRRAPGAAARRPPGALGCLGGAPTRRSPWRARGRAPAPRSR